MFCCDGTYYSHLFCTWVSEYIFSEHRMSYVNACAFQRQVLWGNYLCLLFPVLFSMSVDYTSKCLKFFEDNTNNNYT